MMGQPATAEAIALAREHPGLQIGWHLHLVDSIPLTRAAWPWNESLWRAGLRIGLTPGGRRLMQAEVRAQWDAFVATGLEAQFINCHHHLHAHPHVYREILRVVPRPFRGWLRLGDVRWFGAGDQARQASGLNGVWQRRRQQCPWQTSDTLWGVDRIRRMSATEVRRAIETLPPGRHEFMFHPMNTDTDADFAALVELRGSG